MEILKDILLVFHIVGVAGLFGGWFLQLKAIGKGEAQIPAGMVHSGWLALVTGDLTWADAVADGRVTASGERSDLSELLPLPGPRRTVRTAPGTGAQPADGEAPTDEGTR